VRTERIAALPRAGRAIQGMDEINEEARAGPLDMARQYEQPGGWI